MYYICTYIYEGCLEKNTSISASLFHMRWLYTFWTVLAYSYVPLSPKMYMKDVYCSNFL